LVNQIHASDDPAGYGDDQTGDEPVRNSDVYEIYTTKGVLARVSGSATAVFGFGSKEIFSVNKYYEDYKIDETDYHFDQTGDISCELTAKKSDLDKFYGAGILNASVTGRNNGAPNLDMFWYDTRAPADRLPFDNEDAVYTSDAPTNIFHCLNKGSLFTMLNFNIPERNPPHINLYTAEKLYQKQYKYSQEDFKDKTKFDDDFFDETGKVDMDFETYTIVPDFSTNWASGDIADSRQWFKTQDERNDDVNDYGDFQFYKFYPAKESSYNYVAQCSNRGICQEESGLCECFSGYTGDSCSEQNSLAV